jgi:hypothetical protein
LNLKLKILWYKVNRNSYFCGYGNRGSVEKLSNLPKISEPMNNRIKFKPGLLTPLFTSLTMPTPHLWLKLSAGGMMVRG